MTGLFLSQFDECMESGKYLSKITSDREAAIEFGVNSTPTLFLNGVNIGGLKEYGYYRVRLEEALNEVDG
jgi:protein-disulfide isomerase